MTETNDYEKARQECWDNIVELLPIMTQKSLDKVWEIFDSTFDRAYKLGKAHAENKGSEWQARNDGSLTGSFIRHFDGESTVIPNRTTIAAMAMQGLLSGSLATSPAEFVAKRALGYADALLAEIGKERQ